MSDEYQQFLLKLNGQQTQHFDPTTPPTFDQNGITFYLNPTTPPSVAAHLSTRLAGKVGEAIRAAWGDDAPGQFFLAAGEGRPDPEPDPIEDDLPSLPDSRTSVKNFTPVIDSLAQELGLIPAAIYGVIWRYCQMNSRTCYASQKTIAERLGIDRKTVNRNIKPLLNEAYIRCLNSKTKGESKVYIVTNKVEIDVGISIEARVNGQP